MSRETYPAYIASYTAEKKISYSVCKQLRRKLQHLPQHAPLQPSPLAIAANSVPAFMGVLGYVAMTAFTFSSSLPFAVDCLLEACEGPENDHSAIAVVVELLQNCDLREGDGAVKLAQEEEGAYASYVCSSSIVSDFNILMCLP